MYPSRFPFTVQEEVKTFHDKDESEEIIMITRTLSQKILKGVLLSEEKEFSNITIENMNKSHHKKEIYK